jgi:molybdopterin molybdotransferase
MSESKTHAPHDVRMRGFRRRHTVEEALRWLDARLSALEAEIVPLPEAAGRVLAAPVDSDVDVPGFDRATMDGYAVVAESTDGATPYNPVRLTVIGEALPGQSFARTMTRGEAVRIMTGAPLPSGADAVLQAESVEDTGSPALGGIQPSNGEVSSKRPSAAKAEAGDEPGRGESAVLGRRSGLPALGRVQLGRAADSAQRAPAASAEAFGAIAAIEPVSPGRNIGRRGEDIARGDRVLDAGRLLRPQDLGVMSSIGLAEAAVVRRPRVRLVITGSELLPGGSRPHGFHVTDANGPMLAALAGRDGAIVEFPGLVPDEPRAILDALRAEADVVIVSGGSSVGAEDFAPMLLAEQGELAVHGIAMRPSSPTGLGTLGRRLVFLLPGNPVSALCAYDFFAGRAIRALGGRPKPWPYRRIRAPLTRKISSPIGRLDYARVRLVDGCVEPLSISGASMLSSTTRADGFVIVGDDSEGFAPGAEVDVWLYG